MYPDLAIGGVIAPYGLLLATGLVPAWLLARLRARAAGIDGSHIELMLPLVFVAGIAGARLLPVLTGDLSLGEPGLSADHRSRVIGLVAAGLPAAWAYCRISGLPFRRTLDLLAVPVLLWLACVRVGCFLAGCCWGDDVSAHWQPAVVFPAGSPAWLQQVAAGVITPVAPSSLPVHPTQLYELALLLSLLAVVALLERRRAGPGLVTALAIAGYAVGRFFLEFLRADNVAALAGLTVSQFMAAILFLLAVAGVCLAATRPGIQSPATQEIRMPTHRSVAIIVLVSLCLPAIAEDEPPPWQWSEDKVFAEVNRVRAGRDLNPDSWPDGGRVAVLLSFDVDNETVWLRDGDTNVGGLSQGEYGSRRALGRVLALLDEYRIPASFFGPAMSFSLAPEMVRQIQVSGRHEIGIHGWIHERNNQLPRDEEERLLRQAVERMTDLTGKRPVGYRAPSWNFSDATLELLLELNFLYDSSLMADDRPYEINANGRPTGLVELPVQWILDDAPLFNPLGDSYSNPRDVLQVWKDEFDVAYDEGTVFVMTMHPHYIGHRSRIVILRELIDHIRSHRGVWFGTHEAAVRWVRGQAGM